MHYTMALARGRIYDQDSTPFQSEELVMACSTCNNDGSCGCVSNYKELNLGSRTVWTLGGAVGLTDIVYGPEEGSPVAPTITGIQGTLTTRLATADFKAAVGFQVSSDGDIWDAIVWLGPNAGTPDFLTGNGPLCYSIHTPTGNLKRRIRWVVRAQQASGSAVAIANVGLVVGLFIR